jgi:diaminopimelate epimerase
MDAVRTLPLVKAHAFGNDFLLMDAAHATGVADLPELARRTCDRHRGIGADGLMLIDPTADGANTRLWNADGSRAEVSGNGVRCAAAWLARERQTPTGATLTIGTVAGPKRLTLLARDGERLTFRAEMGPPSELREEVLDVDGTAVKCVVLRVGNPQCVVLGPATEARLEAIASRLAVHPFFPEGTNVELVSVESPVTVRILIWERGVGPTEASGTGACASAVAAAFAGGASRSVDVVSPGGTQHVEWATDTIWLTGWAEVIGRAEQWMQD